MPRFAGRLSDADIPLANRVGTSRGNKAPPNATAGTVAAWRPIANVPAYGM
jgi:hypothetical protein